MIPLTERPGAEASLIELAMVLVLCLFMILGFVIILCLLFPVKAGMIF